jgi:ribonuclease J
VREFGMNMMAVSCGDTAIVIDAGVMFPEPELLGRGPDHPGPVLPRARGKIAALVLTHGHEDHIGAVPHVWPHVDGPVYGTALTLALVEPKLEEHGIDAAGRLRDREAARPVTIGAVHDRVPPRHAQHARLRGARDHTPVGHDRPHRRLQDRPDAARRRARSTCTASPSSAPQGVLALFGDSTNVDRPGFAGSELDVTTPSRRSSRARRQDRRRDVLVEPLPDADPGGPGRAVRRRKVAFVGRGMIENSEIAQRLGYLRVPPAW